MTGTITPKLKTTASLFLATVLASGNAVAVDLAQKPLFLTGSVRPNVLYMTDDSGSMQFETMPGEIAEIWGDGNDSVSYVYPPDEADIYGGSDYDGRPAPGFSSTDKWAAFFRSPANNLMYYNPKVNYKPWIKADGSLMDDAEPKNAPNHPWYDGTDGREDRGDRNLTSETTEDYTWVKENVSKTATDHTETESRTFYPAVYFEYNGDSSADRLASERLNVSNYTRVKIEDGKGPFDGGPNRTDCGADTSSCTYEQEIQNFANWYTYHRSRALAARNGVGRAFSERSGGIRVAYGSINDGITDNIRKFTGTPRDNFFKRLYGDNVKSAGTPLRTALEDAGEYYENDDSDGPWNSKPADSSDGVNHACRSSYTVLMTDGYRSGSSPGVGNSDGTSGNKINNPDPDGSDYTYSATDPFQDSRTNTLGDVAMKYWKRDLVGSMDNEVPTSERDIAFWQHMVTYGVGMGVQGEINPQDAFDKIGTGEKVEQADGTKGWPDPGASNSAKVDDLLHAAVNSRGEYFSALDPETFTKKMSDILQQLVGRSAGSGASVAANSTRLETDTLVFQGRFDSRDWSGDLWAFNLDADGNLTTTSWEAADLLNSKDPANRNILTVNGLVSGGVTAAGANFTWTELSPAQRLALRDGDSLSKGQKRLQYLRGDQSNEEQNNGSFRNRDTVMGDVINSRPVYTKDERYGYANWTTTKGKKYVQDHIRPMQGYDGSDPQPGMVYVGGNDGMLHGFDAETGEEVFSFVPGGVYDQLADLTKPAYSHKYYVDGSATVGDAYIDTTADGTNNPEWKRILIGTLNAGGTTVFALDITNPKSMTKDDVLWEYTDAGMGEGIKNVSLVRVEVENKNNSDPVHRWDVVFGDGYGQTSSSSDDAKLYVLGAEDGKPRSNTPIEVASGNENGMATPFVVDEDQDRNADMIYAGDLRGNVWKFTLDSNKDWTANTDPLFTAKDVDGNRQPITSKVDVGLTSKREKVVTFGTGKYLETADNDPAGAQPQDLYGIIDRNYSSTVTRSELVKQSLESQITEEGREYRIVSDNKIADSDKGWHVSLDPADPDGGGAKQGERSVVQPLVRGGVVTFVTIVPSDDPCDAGGTSWLTSVNINDGSRLAGSFFDVNDDGVINEDDFVEDPLNSGQVAPTSLKTKSGIVDTPTLLAGEDKDTLIVSGSEDEEAISTAADETKGPQSWRQVR